MTEHQKTQLIGDALELAITVLGSEGRARRWLTSSIPALNHRVPIELLDAAEGYEAVKVILGRIASGSF
jgi:uncharacterized protein (DUF2384 family)